VAAFARIAALAPSVLPPRRGVQYLRFQHRQHTRPCTAGAALQDLQRRHTGGAIRFLSDLGDSPASRLNTTVEGSGYSMITIRSIRLRHWQAPSATRSRRRQYQQRCRGLHRGLHGGAIHHASSRRPTKLFVSDTVSRANGSDGLYVDAVNALADIRIPAEANAVRAF
jgi:hypothetical protein